MPILSLAIQKGGSGKTTTAINLAAALQQMGRSVLLLDLDPQANLTQAFGLSDEEEPNIYQAFHQAASGQQVDLKGMIQERSGLRLIPAALVLAGAELELTSVYGRELLLKQMLESLSQQYDCILIDCPPAISMLTVNALVASDYILMPLQAEFLPLKGVHSFMHHYETIQRTLNKKLQVLGMVITRFDPRKTMTQEIMNQLRKNYPDWLFDTHIRTNIRLAQAQAAGQDIFTFDRSSNGAVDYLQLAEEVLKRLES